MMALLETDWFIWGIGLILGFQILVVMLGELLYRADRRRLPIAPILRAARNVVLPLLVAQVFVVRVLEVPVETIPARIVATALWISLLYTGLLLVNVLVFEQAPEGTWRHRAPSLFQDLVRMLLVTVGAAIVLAVVWEQDLGGLIAALGVGSIVLGLALVGNLLVVPLTFCIVLCGWFSMLVPFFSVVFNYSALFFINVLLASVRWLDRLPASSWQVNSPPLTAVLLWYGSLIFLFTGAVRLRRRRYCVLVAGCAVILCLFR